MKPTIVDQVRDTFVAANWAKEPAIWGALRVTTLDAAQKIVAAAAKLPDAIRELVLKDKRHTSDAALVAAFREASSIESVTRLCGGDLSDAFRTLRAFVRRDGGHERLMTAEEARALLINTRADADQHIDTTVPLSLADTGTKQALNALAERLYGTKGDKK